MSKEKIGLFGEEKPNSTLRQKMANYLKYWPVFVICILLCVGAGLVYIRYTSPKYISTTAFLVKGAEYGQQSSQDLIESAMGGNRQVNLNNEILLVSSSALMERTVSRHGFNISYFEKGRLSDVDIYTDAPFEIVKKGGSDQSSFKIQIEGLNADGGTCSDGKQENKKQSFKWNVPVSVNDQTVVITPKTQATNNLIYVVEWEPVKKTATKLSSDLAVRSFDSKTSVIQLSIKTENLQRGKDILNALFKEFNLSNIEDRNELSDSTVSFINERLVVVTDELKNVEGNLENLQQSKRLVDVNVQAKQTLDNSSEANKAIKDINVQQGVTNMISKYFADPANSNKMVPSSLGLDDPNLTGLLNRYNEIILKREKESPNVAPKSTVMQDLNSQASNLKTSILENLTTINKNLNVQEGNFAQQNRQFSGFLSALPHNERMLQEVKRKQSVTEGLYLYLLQKREEAAISRTSANVAHYVQIDPADGYGPVDPNKRNILIYTILLGIALSLGLIYLSNLFSDKISSADEVLQRTNLPLVGTINSIPKSKNQPIAILGRDVTTEEFSAIRAHLSLLLKRMAVKQFLLRHVVDRRASLSSV